jgi:hypothetical protein
MITVRAKTEVSKVPVVFNPLVPGCMGTRVTLFNYVVAAKILYKKEAKHT